MGWRSSFAVLVGSCLIPLIVGQPARCQEYLEPGTAGPFLAEWEADYYRTIRKYLIKEDEKDSRYWVRMVCLPAFLPEWVVTIKKEGPRFRLQLAAAEERFWACELDPAKSAEKVGVRRVSAPIDERTASLIRRVWLNATGNVHARKDDGLYTTDLDYYYFSARGERGGFYCGLVGSPAKGSATGKLVELGELLKRFAQGNAQEVQRAKEAIDRKANELLGAAAH